MSADLLREASALMRSRAEAAMSDLPERGWTSGPTIDPDNMGWYVSSDIPEADWDTTVAHLPYDYEGSTAPHIASWHPTVALAVADWLDHEAERFERYGSRTVIHAADVELGPRYETTNSRGMTYSNFRNEAPSPDPRALAVANAYLGRTS